MSNREEIPTLDELLDWSEDDFIAPDPAERSKWLELNERKDAVEALDFVALMTAQLRHDPAKWKWCIIGSHNALFAAIICTINGTANWGALDRHSGIAVRKWYENTRVDPDAPYPRKIRLANPTDLWERVKDINYMAEYGGKPLEPTPEEEEDILRLISFRNGLVHFLPGGWVIEKAGLPRVTRTAVQFARFLLLEHPANSYRNKLEQRKRIEDATGAIMDTLESLETDATYEPADLS